jgi:hypothetical protein
MSNLFPITTGDDLVLYVQQFTGSSNSDEIKQCIYLTELMMRNIELPALRTNPYSTFGIADSNGFVPIPADMNRPILFFNQGLTQAVPNTAGTQTAGPWIVYDRIGDRDMIGDQMIENLYLKPINIPQVYRGKFSEVGQMYEFLPGLTAGAIVNMYYFTTWPFLFSTDSNGNTVETNVVMQSFPEGYVYGTLHNYYLKRKMPDDANGWLAKFNLAWDTVEDQNNKGKWSGGHNRLTSIFQPRKDRRYTAR